MDRKERGREENTTKSLLVTTSTGAHGLIPTSTGINNSDVDKGWDKMATNDKDDNLMGTLVNNTSGSDNETLDKNSGLPSRNMEYNGNKLDSRD